MSSRLTMVAALLLAATVVVAFRNRARVTPALPEGVDTNTDAEDADAEDAAAVSSLRAGVRLEIVLLSIFGTDLERLSRHAAPVTSRPAQR